MDLSPLQFLETGAPSDRNGTATTTLEWTAWRFVKVGIWSFPTQD